MTQPVESHLVVLIHGLWGSPTHMLAAKQELEKAWLDDSDSATANDMTGPTDNPIITTTLVTRGKEELVIMIAGGMTSQLTYDGIDVCASRVAYEVDAKVVELESQSQRVTKISITGYSLGGLIARFLVGLLASREPSFFDAHRPVSFSTIASPHIGIPIYNTLISTSLGWLGSRLMSRSGEQLWAVDRYSEEDPRPLLEIMADPRLVFHQALERFERLQLYASAINDNSVPYPTAAIDPVDHFTQWDQRNLDIDVNEIGIIRSWHSTGQEDEKEKTIVKHTWGTWIGTLPPPLRYRYPYNYLIIVLFPIMLPLILMVLIFRQSLDTRRSKKRLLQLARSGRGTASPASPTLAPAGLSVDGLRDAIRRVERELESEWIDKYETLEEFSAYGADAGPPGAAIKVRFSDSQMRMALWLNKLPIHKFVTWWPDVANAHATIIVRNPEQFPAHERGRGVLQHWARRVLFPQAH